MFTNSIWNAHAANQSFSELNEDLTVDVAIVGGGITGVTTAFLLKERGMKVAILEAREIGRGTSSHSTGNLYAITDNLLEPLRSKYDKEVVGKIVRARESAVNFIEQTVQRFQIECDFKRLPLYLFEDKNEKDLGAERKRAEEAGLGTADLTEPFPVSGIKGFSYPDQAQFNPLLYIQGLAKVIEGENCSIYENTRVSDIDKTDNGFILKTTGGRVTAKYVIQATHTPKGVELQYHTVLGPYREYGIAAKLQSGTYPEGIFWGYFNGDKFSFRSYSRGGEQYLLCIGRPHKVGQAKDNKEHIQELISFAEEKFKIKEVVYKWGGQNYKPADLLPYIGRKTSNSNELIATGFSTDGLTYGTLSAIINTDIITGRKNEYEALFKASRHNPAKASKEFIKENFDVAAQLVKDWLSRGSDEQLKNIPPGEAQVVKIDNKKVAVYRTNGGEFRAFSAVCTHMGCIVNWNNAEKSWDCPCHGTRFDVEGEVLEGPAFDPLQRIQE
ncbi:FAD-dependent oxidoreductase [Antarcticibacterium sp. 1MA-6-2]|uniref:FAD-dependent oxidoreductase n=1 Tax=Antarcticibacterium sp. 1MA-6-2 TaxID=2908210 RepID=UPI001F39ED1E|nr:FAD-dependent oxidoreductase [Antarcticibacterium sp. 1MA-6-2]UJH91058.1 FAD-dependent oxidoreductase [Antarcticibacterium sp. 1MA-6-2]